MPYQKDNREDNRYKKIKTIVSYQKDKSVDMSIVFDILYSWCEVEVGYVSWIKVDIVDWIFFSVRQNVLCG